MMSVFSVKYYTINKALVILPFSREGSIAVSGFFTPKMLLLLSRFSRVRLCATPETAAHQASPSLGFSRQEHWSGLPFPSPVHESDKWKWSRSVVPDSSRPHGLQPTRLLCPWIFQARVLEWGAIAFSAQNADIGKFWCHFFLTLAAGVNGRFQTSSHKQQQ